MADVSKYDKAIGALYLRMRQLEKEGKVAEANAIRNRIAYLEQLKQNEALKGKMQNTQVKTPSEKISTEHHYGKFVGVGILVVLIVFAVDIFTNALSLPFVQKYLDSIKSLTSSVWPQIEYQWCVFSSQAGVLFNPSTVNSASVAPAKCAKKYLQQSAEELGCVDCYIITGALQRNYVAAGSQAPFTLTVSGTQQQYCEANNACFPTPPALQPTNVPWFEVDAGTFTVNLYGRCVCPSGQILCSNSCQTINATDTFTIQGVINTDCSASQANPIAYLAYDYQTTGKAYINIRTSDSDPKPSSSLPTTTPGPVQVSIIPDAAYFDTRYDTNGIGVTIVFKNAGQGTAYLRTLTLHQIAPLDEQTLSISDYQPRTSLPSEPQFDVPINLLAIPALTTNSPSDAIFITLSMPTVSHYSTYILSADLTYQYFYPTTIGGLLVDTSSCTSPVPQSGSSTQYVISGRVTNGPNLPIENAQVTVSIKTKDGTYQSFQSVNTDSLGKYQITVPEGSYLIMAGKGCESGIEYLSIAKSITVNSNTEQNFQLTPQTC